MKKSILSTVVHSRSGPAAAALACLFLVLSGCAARTAFVQPDRDLTRAFEAGDVPGDFTFYYLGWDNHPYIVLGLKPPFRVGDRFWNVLDPKTASLKKLVDAAYENPSMRPYGSHVRDPAGNRIGVIYTSAAHVSVTVDTATERVSVFTDQPWVLDDHLN